MKGKDLLMKKFLKNENGMELIQALGIAVIVIVLISMLYVGLNGSFNTWLGSFDSSVNSLLDEFSIPTSSCEGGSHTEVIQNAYEGYTGDVYCSVCGNKLRDGTYIEYNITYDADGGTMPSDYPVKYTVVSEEITLPTPTKAGYVFKGWTGSNGPIPQNAVTIPAGSTGHKNYTAEWGTLSTIAAQGGWYKGSVNKNTITSVTFTTSAPSSFDESWDASASGDGSIMAYRQGEAVTVVDVSGFGKIAANSNSAEMFSGFTAAASISGLDLLDTSNVTTMERVFYGCNNLASLGDLSGWNTQNLISMYQMFSGCESLTSLDLSGFNTQNVTTMNSMFHRCKKLTSIGDVSGWNTQKLISMYQMFAGCESLTSLDLSAFDTQSVAYMGGMFFNCYELTSLDLSGWNTQNVTDMPNMFYRCYKLTSIDGISGWDTQNVTDMSGVFYSCNSLASLDLSGWNTQNVTDMSGMFDGCISLTSSFDLSGWNTQNVTTMASMFYYCANLTSLNLSGWNTQKVANFYSMFQKCTSMEAIYVGDGWTTKSGNTSYMFTDCGVQSVTHI